MKHIRTFSKLTERRGQENPDCSLECQLVYIPTGMGYNKKMPRGRKPKIQAASPAILRHFDQMGKRVFNAQEIARILDEQRDGWQLAASTKLEIEITIEFAIDAAQKIQVEGGGDAGGIVVGIQQ